VLRFTLHRLGQSALTLAALALATFVAIRLAPGGPALVLLGQDRYTPALEAEVNRRLGLDRPLPEQLARWGALVSRGDFGDSYFYRRPALEVVLERLPASLLLGGLAFLLSLGGGVAAGVWAARRRGTWLDRALGVGAVVALATPAFWLGIVLIVVFAAWLRLLPSSGMAPVGREADPLARLPYLALPLLTLAVPHGAAMALFARAAMVEALAADYTRTARAKGLGAGAVAWTHALRNAAVPLVTLAGLHLVHLLEGSIAVETVFAWPGVGQLTAASVARRDYPVLMVLTLLVAVGVLLSSLLTDLAYRRIDPRMEAP
jgi:peptide/nickel transport system permease protein